MFLAPAAWHGTTTATSLIARAAAAVALWYAGSAILAWHRLRGIPGPPLASFSYMWGILAMRSGQMHRILPKIQRRYGPLVRVGPNELLVSDPDTLWHINGVRSGYDRGGWYESIRFDPSGHSMLSEPDTARHDARKAQVAASYAGKGHINLEAVVDSQVDVLVDLLRKKYVRRKVGNAAGAEHELKALDFGLIARYFTIDVTTLAGMGEPWGDLAAETDMFQFLGDSDAFVPTMHCISMAPQLRSLFTSAFFLTLAGPKPTDKKGLGQFLG